MITIYQINLTDDQIDAVNSGKTVPAYVAQSRMMFGGAENFSEDYLQYYSKAWEIDTNNLEQAFAVSNYMDETVNYKRFGQVCSGSVGNIFVDESGNCFICDTFGFTAVGYYDMEAV